jgi:hypothetical protein
MTVARPVAALVAAALVTTNLCPGLAQEKPANPDKKKVLSQPVPGYTLKKIEGFDVLVHDDVLTHNEDGEFKRVG